MWSIKNKLPMGLVALCAVSIVGLKDTGVFINEHVQRTYSGNEISFAIGEQVNIVEKTGNSYIVKKGKAKVTIPEDKILVKEVNIPTYKVVKSSPIKKDGKVVRNLFIGEYAIEVKNNKDTVTIKLNDGTVGDVSKSVVEKVANKRENKTEVKVKSNAVAKSNNGKLKLKAGESVSVVDYNDGDFIIKDDNGKKYTLEAEKLSLESGKKSNNVQAKDEAKNIMLAMDNDSKEIEKIAKQASKDNSQDFNDFKYKSSENISPTASKIIASAYDKMGSTYVYGSTGDGGFDCSGLVYAIYKDELGIKLPRSSSEQSGFGKQVDRSDLIEGDLIFFNTTGSGVSHVGIYIGGGRFIHASSGAGKVIESSLSEDYYSSRYVNATRVF